MNDALPTFNREWRLITAKFSIRRLRTRFAGSLEPHTTPRNALNVAKMFAGTKDMCLLVMGLVKTVFCAERITARLRRDDHSARRQGFEHTLRVVGQCADGNECWPNRGGDCSSGK